MPYSPSVTMLSNYGGLISWVVFKTTFDVNFEVNGWDNKSRETQSITLMSCDIMNLPPLPTKFSKFNNTSLQAAKKPCKESMAEAGREAVEKNNEKSDIAAED
ncbi:hypothetical protein NPIL_516781 [Nephila pilipes]|uniref:Uncharacterized protein n=1 Tax=Nephila pilipes TaxID=299642 RepID=A0A8X6TWJ7_NEPPI|nr:hypothetical protein NPIL_516781 [Nephila pilipes]